MKGQTATNYGHQMYLQKQDSSSLDDESNNLKFIDSKSSYDVRNSNKSSIQSALASKDGKFMGEPPSTALFTKYHAFFVPFKILEKYQM